MSHELLASQLIWNCLTSKHMRYADEREVRGIIMNTQSKFDPWRRTHAGATTWSTNCRSRWRAPSLRFIGPHVPPDAEADVRTFLSAQGYAATVPVRRSL